MTTDFYQTLNVAPTASAEEIKKAYRRQARLTHPDTGGTDEAFRAVQEAWTTLGDPVQRKMYDDRRSVPIGRPDTGYSFGNTGMEDVYAAAYKLYEEQARRREAEELLRAELYVLAQPKWPLKNIGAGYRFAGFYPGFRLSGVPYDTVNRWKTRDFWALRGALLATLLFSVYTLLTQVVWAQPSATGSSFPTVFNWVFATVLSDAAILFLLFMVGFGVQIYRWAKYTVLARIKRRK